jgi:hypothetical protein
MTYELAPILEEVKRLGTEYPNAIYEKSDEGCGCFYTKGAAGPGEGCIFGQAILNVYPDLRDFLVEFDRIAAEEGETSITTLLRDLDIPYTHGDPIDDVQYSQDQKKPWGQAITYLGELKC